MIARKGSAAAVVGDGSVSTIATRRVVAVLALPVASLGLLRRAEPCTGSACGSSM